MGSSIEAGWVFRRRHLIVLVGVVAPQIAQPMVAHDSVVHRILYDVAFGAITLLVSFAIFLRAWERWLALIFPAIAPLCERGVLLCQDPPFVKGRFRRAKISPLQKGRSVVPRPSPLTKGDRGGFWVRGTSQRAPRAEADPYAIKKRRCESESPYRPSKLFNCSPTRAGTSLSASERLYLQWIKEAQVKTTRVDSSLLVALLLAFACSTHAQTPRDAPTSAARPGNS